MAAAACGGAGSGSGSGSASSTSSASSPSSSASSTAPAGSAGSPGSAPSPSTGSGSGSGSGSAGAGTTVAAANNSSVGTTILVDGKGRTLYLFAKDTGTSSTCYGPCASAWPPLLTTGKAKAGTGVTASLLGTTTRKDGKTQVTYHGHPLYYYAADTKAGQAYGQGLPQYGAKWYVVSPAGQAVKSGGGSSGGGYSGGY